MRNLIRSKRAAGGFTLIELMVVAVIITILAAVAIPSYTRYIVRARLNDAFSSLALLPTDLDAYSQSNNYTFVGFENDTRRFPKDTENFTYSVVESSQSAIIVKATGRNQADQFEYTIDQAGNRKTTRAPDGYLAAGDTSANCWVVEKGGVCFQ